MKVVPMVSIRRRRETFFIASAIARPRIASAICVPPTVSFHFRDNRIASVSVVQDVGYFCEPDECRIGGTCSFEPRILRPTLSKDRIDASSHPWGKGMPKFRRNWCAVHLHKDFLSTLAGRGKG